MIRGKINAELEAAVPIEVLGTRGIVRSVVAVIDTGFTGELTLASQLIEELGLKWAGGMKGTLADGRKVEFDVFAAKVTWHGNEKRVAVLDSGGGNLIGMSMLKGSRVTIDVADDGTVQIEPLSPQNRRVRRRRQG